MPECPQCGVNYRKGQKECEVCGLDLTTIQTAPETESQNLITCEDCGQAVSARAKACPFCGAPIAKKLSTVATFIIYLIIGIMGMGGFVGYKKYKMDQAEKIRIEAAEKKQKETKRADRIAQREKEAAERRIERERKEANCKYDLKCWGGKHAVDAMLTIRENIERRAKYQFEWLEGAYSYKHVRFKWKNKSAGVLTYLGDGVKFQNGFGAWQNMIYQCDYDPASGQATNIKVYPGRL